VRFRIVSMHSQSPLTIYDGGEPSPFRVAVETTVGSDTVRIPLDLDAPECAKWRHYYSDIELNELVQTLHLRFKFLANREVVVEPATMQPIYFQPFLLGNDEVSVCFTYDEVSNGHFIFWLVGVLSRPFSESEYAKRIEDIERYWRK